MGHSVCDIRPWTTSLLRSTAVALWPKLPIDSSWIWGSSTCNQTMATICNDFALQITSQCSINLTQQKLTCIPSFQTQQPTCDQGLEATLEQYGLKPGLSWNLKQWFLKMLVDVVGITFVTFCDLNWSWKMITVNWSEREQYEHAK